MPYFDVQTQDGNGTEKPQDRPDGGIPGSREQLREPASAEQNSAAGKNIRAPRNGGKPPDPGGGCAHIQIFRNRPQRCGTVPEHIRKISVLRTAEVCGYLFLWPVCCWP